MKLGTRMTKQKKVILEVVKNTKSHPTADWVYEQARKVLPDISLGTVYRNLHMLSQLGIISELNYSSSHTRYDGNPEPHYHFVCEKCGKILDVDLPVQSQLEELVEQALGLEIKNHRLEFYGECEECKGRTTEKKTLTN